MPSMEPENIKLHDGADFRVFAHAHKMRENHRHDCIEMVYVMSGTASHSTTTPTMPITTEVRIFPL